MFTSVVSQDWAEKCLAKLGLSVTFGSICGSSLFFCYKDLVRLVDGTRISFVLWTILTKQSEGAESSSVMALDTVHFNDNDTFE